MNKRFETERILLSYTLAALLIVAVFRVYDYPDGMLMTLVKACGFLIVPFGLCYLAERHRVIGGIAITAAIAIVWRVITGWMWTGWRTYGVGFQEWALTAGTEVEDAGLYLNTLWLGSALFFGLTVYYFAKVLYRPSFLMLVSLLPCVLYAKVFADIENVFVILIACLNLLLMIFFQNTKSEGLDYDTKAGVAWSGVCFVAAVFLLVSLIPKQEKTKYYDVFEDLFLGGDTRTELGADFSDIGMVSGDAGRYSELGNRRLYRVSGDGIGYLKRQNFDLYDFQRDRWTFDADFSEQSLTMDEWKDGQSNCNGMLFQEALKQAESLSPGFAGRYGLEALLAEPLTDSLHRIKVESLNFAASYYVAPGRTVEIFPKDGESVVATPSGCFRRESGLHPRDFSYEVVFYDQYGTRRKLLELGAGKLSMEDWGRALAELTELLPEEGALYREAVQEYLEQYLHAAAYQNACAQNNRMISAEIAELSREVVRDCTSDFEKAAALEEFFQSSDFTYDLKYRAKDNSPEYFLFTSRRGTCSDYACAYVLMARAAGLTVRYAEGYVPEKASYEGVYYVKDSTSHAYPEVYLPLLGWTVFEPTSANVELYEEEQDGGWLHFLKTLKIDFGLAATVFGFVLALAGGVVIVRVVWPVLEEGCFRLLLLVRRPDASVEKMYARVVSTCRKRMDRRADTLTPRELADALTEYEIDIRQLSEAMEGHAYAGKNVSKEMKKQSLRDYRSFIRKKHRLRKK
ncbi:MAG: transglutaminase family protein [Acetatifactor sp.]